MRAPALAIIVDVEATTAIRQAEVLAAKRMVERSMDRFDLYPAWLMGDSAYGSAEMLARLVYIAERRYCVSAPHLQYKFCIAAE